MPSPGRANRVLLLVGFAVGACVSAAAPHASARSVVVETTAGATFEGELVSQSNEQIVVNVSGIEAVIPQADVSALRFLEDPEVIYEKRRAALAADDLEGRLKLVVAMYDLGAIDLAHRAAVSVTQDFPESREGAEMQRLIEAKRKLANTQVSMSPAERSAPRRMQAGRARPIEGQPLLTDEQINVVKVYEVKLEAEPRVVVPPATLDKLFTDYATSPMIPKGRKEQDAFKRAPGYEQLDLIFKVQARELYDQVQVKTEPATLAEFRRSVSNGYVSDYFEPTFGRGQVPDFSLLSGRADSEPVSYTNFFLLNRYANGGFRMIDRDSPADSLLLQWGLPREGARSPAPEIEGWKARFRSTEDPEYQSVLAWIGTLVKHNSHDFGLTYPAETE